MKRTLLCLLSVLCCAAANAQSSSYTPVTLRGQAQYLSTDQYEVEDTCPGHDILKQFTCTKKDRPGFSCFDVYMVQGDPVDAQRYTLLNESLTTVSESAEPRCTFEELTCDNFLKSLKYNLNFSWFIDNFPSSSFPQCAETYSCTRVSCLLPLPNAQTGGPQAQKLSCVFKKNQIYFLGAEISCRDKNAAKS